MRVGAGLALVVALGACRPPAAASPPDRPAPARTRSRPAARPAPPPTIAALSAIVFSSGSTPESAAAIIALGQRGDPAAVAALVHAHFASWPSLAELALARVGADGAEPRLIERLSGEHAASALRLLGRIGSAEAIRALRGVLADRHQRALWPAAAAALARATARDPAQRATTRTALRRLLATRPDPATHINLVPLEYDASCRAGGWGRIGDDRWLALDVAPWLAMLGDPRDVDAIARVRAGKALRGDGHLHHRLSLLTAEVALARHAEAPRVAAALARERVRIAALAADGACAGDRRAALLSSIDSLAAAVELAASCRDGDLSCYQLALPRPEADVARKAALLIAWTTTAPADRAAARADLLARASAEPAGPGTFNPLWVDAVDSWFLFAVDVIAAAGCDDCGPALERLAAEDGLRVVGARAEAAWLQRRLRSR